MEPFIPTNAQTEPSPFSNELNFRLAPAISVFDSDQKDKSEILHTAPDVFLQDSLVKDIIN